MNGQSRMLVGQTTHTFIQDEGIDLADEGAQLPGSEVGKLRFTRSPRFGKVGSQTGGDAT